MTDKYVPQVQHNEQGIPLNVWHVRYVEPLMRPGNALHGDELVAITQQDGSKTDVPVRCAAAVFKGFEAKRGHANAVGVENLIGFVDLFHVAVSPLGYKEHPLVNGSTQEEARKCLVVPLGYWPSHLAVNEPYQTVMMQNARYQVTSGANTGDMAWHHVVSCSMKQLHMLTFQASNCESKAEQVVLIRTAGFVARALAHLFRAHPKIKMPVTAILSDNKAEDMLERCLAWCFSEQPWSVRTFWMIFCKIFQRCASRDLFAGQDQQALIRVPGPAACLIFAPLLREFVQGQSTLDEVITRFNAGMKSTLDALIAVMVRASAAGRAVEPMKLNRTLMTHLATSLGYPLSDEVCRSMLVWFEQSHRTAVDYPLERWNLVPPVVAPFVFGDRVFSSSNASTRIENKSILVLRGDQAMVPVAPAAVSGSVHLWSTDSDDDDEADSDDDEQWVTVRKPQPARPKHKKRYGRGRGRFGARATPMTVSAPTLLSAPTPVATVATLVAVNAFSVLDVQEDDAMPSGSQAAAAATPLTLGIEPTEVCEKWSGFTLGSNGTYRLVPTMLAPAQAMANQPDAAPLVSDMWLSFTVAGQRAEEFPSSNWGMSASGRLFSASRGTRSVGADRRPMKLDSVPIEVTVTGLGTMGCVVRIVQEETIRGNLHNIVEVTQAMPGAVQLVISYKYLQFDVTYDRQPKPIPKPIPSPVKARVAVHAQAAAAAAAAPVVRAVRELDVPRPPLPVPTFTRGMRKLAPGELSSMCGFKFGNDSASQGSWRRR